MAYLRDLDERCQSGCGRRATKRLMTFRNEAYGVYCGRCAGQMLKMVNRDENRYFEEQRRLQS